MTGHRVASSLRTAAATPTAWILLVASIVVAAGSMTANLATLAADELASVSGVQQVMHASTMATLTFALVAGIVLTTSDMRFGRIDQLLLSEPRVSRVLGPNVAAGAMVGVGYWLAGSLVATVTGSSYYRWQGIDFDLTSAIVIRPLVGAVIGAALFCVMGIGLGHVVRNQPLALGLGLSMLLIVQPPMLLGVPSIGRWLPGASGLSLTLSPDDELIGQVAGGVVAVGWAALAIGGGLLRLRSARAG